MIVGVASTIVSGRGMVLCSRKIIGDVARLIVSVAEKIELLTALIADPKTADPEAILEAARIDALLGKAIAQQARVADADLPPRDLSAIDGRLVLGCAEGTLELVRVKPAGKRAMSATDFLRGHQVPKRAVSP